MRRTLLMIVLLLCMLCIPAPVTASDLPLGVHLLDPGELNLVLPYRGDAAEFYVTVPLAMNDRRKDVWDRFFETAFKAGITPIVRWVTVFKDDSWSQPNRSDVVQSSTFLSTINWPGRRIIVLWNEPNHSKEWGGKVDPEGYADIANFAANWLKTEGDMYEILPAGLDAAAPNGGGMIDNLQFIDRMYQAQPDLFSSIDGWASHSYPNPGFSSNPYRNGKNSIRGFETELNKLKALTGKTYPVYITETGWKASRGVNRLLPNYYQYSAKNVWNHPEVKAVTVFVLRGFNGPFAEFSLLDSENKPTQQMKALMKVLNIPSST